MNAEVEPIPQDEGQNDLFGEYKIYITYTVYINKDHYIYVKTIYLKNINIYLSCVLLNFLK